MANPWQRVGSSQLVLGVNLVCMSNQNIVFHREWHHQRCVSNFCVWPELDFACGLVHRGLQLGSDTSLPPKSCGRDEWAKRPVMATSPRLASSSGSGQEIARESKTGARSWAQLCKSKHRLQKVVGISGEWIFFFFTWVTEQSRRGRHELKRISFLVKSFYRDRSSSGN